MPPPAPRASCRRDRDDVDDRRGRDVDDGVSPRDDRRAPAAAGALARPAAG